MLRSRGSVLLLTALVFAVAPTGLSAQRRYGWLPGSTQSFSVNNKYDGRFRFVRLTHECVDQWRVPCRYYRGLLPWEHGFPVAEQNLMQIMSATTALDPHVEDSLVVSIEDPELTKYPVAYMTEAGFWTTNDKEAAAFRAYLLKGGFAIFDDFRDPLPRGGGGWANFESNMARVVPGAQWVRLTAGDPIFHSFFEINDLTVLKQRYPENTPPQYLGLYENNDRQKRLLAVANYNVDISDWWEFSGQGYTPVDATNEAYKFGVNYIVYGLTH
jgi:hypothetical protein